MGQNSIKYWCKASLIYNIKEWTHQFGHYLIIYPAKNGQICDYDVVKILLLTDKPTKRHHQTKRIDITTLNENDSDIDTIKSKELTYNAF